MEFSRQEYWSGLPFPSAGDLPSLGMEPGSPILEMAASLPSEPPGKQLTAKRLLTVRLERIMKPFNPDLPYIIKCIV